MLVAITSKPAARIPNVRTASRPGTKSPAVSRFVTALLRALSSLAS